MLGTAIEHDEAMPLTPVKSRPTKAPSDLPNEVVAEALQVKLNMLQPGESDQWAIDAQVGSNVGFAAVGKLADVLTEALSWLEGLGKAWQRKLKERDDQLGL